MIRYSIFLFSAVGMAATALAHVMPLNTALNASHGSSVAYMSAPAHHIVLEKCTLEDCSDTPQ